MNRALRLSGALIAGLLILLLLGALALVQLFDPNDYKAQIRSQIQARSGLDIELRGPISWRLFPWLGLELRDLQLAGRDPAQTLLHIDELGIAVQLLPLLRRDIQMDALRVEGLQLDLVRGHNGRGNWELPLTAGGSAGKSTDAPARPSASDTRSMENVPAASAPSATLRIDGLTLNNARIDYRDLASGQQLSLQGLQLQSSALAADNPADLRASGHLSLNQPALQARLSLQSTLQFDAGLRILRLEATDLRGDLTSSALNGQPLDLRLRGDLQLDTARRTLSAQKLHMDANQLSLLGQLELQGGEAPRLSGELSIAAFDLRALLQQLRQTLPAMADEQALRQVALASRIQASPEQLRLQDLRLQLDDSQLDGQLQLTLSEPPRLELTLAGNRLNLDRYLAPQASDERATADTGTPSAPRAPTTARASAGASSSALPAVPTEERWSAEPLLDPASLRRLNGRLELALNQLTLRDLPFEQVTLKAEARNGRLSLEDAQADLLGGRLQLAGQLNSRATPATLALRLHSSGLDLARLLTQLEPSEPPALRGSLQLQAELSARGNSEQVLIGSLAGNARLQIDNGALNDANLEQQLCRGIALLNRKPLTQPFSERDTPLQTLSSSLRLQNGVAHSDDLLARLPGLTVKGAGDIDLRVLGLDYRLGVTLEGDQRAMPDPACQVNPRYAGIAWPLHCRGPLELGARACRLDSEGLGEIARQLAGSRLEEKLEEKLDEKLGDKLSPELKDALRGLFRR
ncbi:AsmA family protein [Pseudomonas sp. NW5]|uniref:AsmA family protein n=1 Tax=Pseudomonas sp. NW5 TaxID=2934934 RepID=UPI0020225AA0|nr:AsmA family protein [Pseudomonas sp. NW5]MCL7462353.1 AsmA family protein [Pseudomonas sp. NW5]